jgi:hypothetical protein
MKAHIRDPRGVTIALAKTDTSDTTHVGFRVGPFGKIAFLCGVYLGTQKMWVHGEPPVNDDLTRLQPTCKHCQNRLVYHNSPSTVTPRKVA